MTLGIRKIIVVSIIGLVFLAGNILLVASWLADKGVEERANWIRQEFLTGTSIAVIIALLILLVNPKSGSSRSFTLIRRCPVCDHGLTGSPNYCGDCGSKVS
jgi:membrane-bound acyltransferase YfiQ involved in biofilm formation